MIGLRRGELTKDEIALLEKYLTKTFGSVNVSVRPQPKKPDMAEVFINEEFVATLYREDDEGEISYQFQMAILDFDLADAEA